MLKALSPAPLSAAAVYVGFSLLLGLPMALVLVQAVLPGLFAAGSDGPAFSLDPLRRALASPSIALSILHSVELAALVSLAATALGGALAVLTQRCRIPGRQAIALLPWLVFLTPSYLKALAWVLLMMPGGYLAQLGLVTPSASRAFFSLGGLVFVHTLSLFPLASFIIGGALAGLGRDVEDAARLAGASTARIWLRINLPLLAPAIAVSAIAVFAEVLSDFGMASTIARMSSFGVLTYGIYAAASDYPVDFPLAAAQALILLALIVAVVLADQALRRQAGPRLISGRSRPARTYDLAAWRWPAALLALAVGLAAFGLPLGAIAARAFTQTLGNGLDLANLTLDNLSTVLSPGTATSQSLLRSLACAGIAAFFASLAALVLSVQIEGAGRVMRPLVLAVSLGAVAIPGIVLGFGYILMWNRTAVFRDLAFPHYGDLSLLVTGYVAAALPYCLVVVMAAVGQLAPSLADAARLHGAGPVRRLVRITLPLVLVSVTTAFLLTFIRTVFELPVSQMLVPLSGPPAPPLILKQFSHDNDGAAAALCLVAMIGAGSAAAAILVAVRRLAARLLRPAPVSAGQVTA